MAVGFSTPKYEHMDVKALFTNCCPLSDKMVSGILYRITQLLKKILETWADLVFQVRIAVMSLLYQSFILTRTGCRKLSAKAIQGGLLQKIPSHFSVEIVRGYVGAKSCSHSETVQARLNCTVTVSNHVRTVKVSLKRVLRTVLAEVTCQSWMVCMI